ncbi:MAG: serine hydrolase domain-containing protein [Kiritimatiellia bacterium]
MKKLMFAGVALAFAPWAKAYFPEATPESQGISSKAIRAWIDASERELDALHGFVLVRHGKLVAEGYWAPYARDRTHMLYSHSKSFTATAIGFLVQDGKLDLDERVAAIFPDKLPASPSDHLLRLRVRDLLTMTTGSEQDSIRPVTAAADGDWVRAFLAHPIEKDPGTWFVYNTGATYMLAAIAEKRTGERLMDYLDRKLFKPTGITSAWTTTCPKGIACGGYGMNMTTRDLATFGQFCLQKGRWNGAQLLSEDWMTLMTAKQTETRRNPKSDWGRGYGFQFWRCVPEGVYRADGARGQYTIVMPRQDAVLSITAGLSDMQKELDLVWKHLLPAFGTAELPEDSLAHDELKRKCETMRLPPVKGEKDGAFSVVLGKEYVYEKNPQGIRNVKLSRTEDGWELTFEGPFGEQRVPVGYDAWKYGKMKLEKETYETLGGLIGDQPTASSGAWTAPDTFTCRTYLCGGPYCLDATLKFTAATLKVDVVFVATHRPRLSLVGAAK